MRSGRQDNERSRFRPVLAALSLVLAAGCGAAGCGAPAAVPSADRPDRAQRIVSLDFCADQYVLKLAGPDRILALSPHATAEFSYMRDAAQGLPQVRPIAEDALVLQPDLVVRSYGGGPNAAAMFERAGVPVLQVGWAGDLPGIRRVTEDMGKGLGAEAQAAEILADMDRRLGELRQTGERSGPRLDTLYVTPSGATTGAGSLVHEILQEAGLANFEQRAGWRSLPLERLANTQPDLVAAAFFDSPGQKHDRWSSMRHPIAQAQLKTRPVVDLPSAWMSCGAWFAVDAVEALSRAAVRAEENRR